MTLRNLALFFAALGAASAQMPGSPGFGGPSILQGGGAAQPGSEQFLTLRPFVQVMGTYTKSLLPYGTDPAGRLSDDNYTGLTGAAGVYGYHSWRHSLLGINYRMDARHYTNGKSNDGIDQFLNLGFNHQMSPRITLAFNQSAGMFARSFGNIGQMGFSGLNFGNIGIGVDPNASFLPQDELFDTRTFYAASNGSLRFQKSRRLAFNFSGTGFLTRRRADGLAGVHGASAETGVSWALSQRQTIGAFYTFTKQIFTSSFGESDIHMTGGNYSVALTPKTAFTLAAGVFRLESQRLTKVALDPVIAALLGQSTGTEVFHGINYGNVFSAGLSHSFRRSGVNLMAARFISPGNGLYLTSQRDLVTAGYSYSGFRRLGMGVSVNHSRMKALTQQLGRYKSYMGSVNTSYRIGGSLHLSATAGVRRYDLGSRTRDSYILSAGFTFAPGDVPVTFW